MSGPGQPGRRAAQRLRAGLAPVRDRPAGDWLTDAALFVFAVGLGGLAFNTLRHSHGELLDILDLAFGIPACLAMWVRRAWPMAVLVVAGAAAFFSPLALGAALVAIGTAAARARGRAELILAAVLGVAGGIVFPLANPAGGELVTAAFPASLLLVVAFGLGLYIRARRELVASLRERAERLEADRQHSDELAREAERRRIAREMHDVLAHRLSLLSLHAGALEFRPDAPAGEIARAAAVIRTSAAAALSELREVITVLREEPDDAAAPPQPDLDRLPDLLEESRQAGMTLRAWIDGPAAGSLPAALGRTAYRVIQEGLTNARRHAPGAAVEVTVVTSGPDALVAEVISRPPAGGPAPAAPAAGGGPGAGPAGGAGGGTGAGLIGLAERLALIGGELEHGPNPAGDFVLRATVPRTA
jgi:signal transduction histidine kinase